MNELCGCNLINNNNGNKLTNEELLQVGLLNVDGYYNSLLSFIDKAVDEGFISCTARRIIVSAPTPKELIRELEVHNTLISSLNNNQTESVVAHLYNNVKI